VGEGGREWGREGGSYGVRVCVCAVCAVCAVCMCVCVCVCVLLRVAEWLR
jgi:hypothetical protein